MFNLSKKEISFNGAELVALINVGVAIAAADGNTTDDEFGVLSQLLVGLNVSPEQAEVLIKESTQIKAPAAVAILSAMSTTQKKFATGFLAKVILADGDIDDNEIKIWKVISTICHFPTMSMNEAIEYVDQF